MTDKKLREVGLKITVSRINILKILQQYSNDHLSAEKIYQKLIEQKLEVGLATIYRVLSQFESAKLVIKHQFENECSVYELNTGEHHDHIVCTECGLVEEFVDQIIEERQLKIAEKLNFLITNHSLYLYGLCKECR